MRSRRHKHNTRYAWRRRAIRSMDAARVTHPRRRRRRRSVSSHAINLAGDFFHFFPSSLRRVSSTCNDFTIHGCVVRTSTSGDTRTCVRRVSRPPRLRAAVHDDDDVNVFKTYTFFGYLYNVLRRTGFYADDTEHVLYYVICLRHVRSYVPESGVYRLNTASCVDRGCNESAPRRQTSENTNEPWHFQNRMIYIIFG